MKSSAWSTSSENATNILSVTSNKRQGVIIKANADYLPTKTEMKHEGTNLIFSYTKDVPFEIQLLEHLTNSK